MNKICKGLYFLTVLAVFVAAFYFIKYYPVNIRFKIENNSSNLQFFFDSGKGFREYESIRYSNNLNFEKSFWIFRFNRELMQLRIDPRENPGKFRIAKLTIKPFLHHAIDLKEERVKYHTSQQITYKQGNNDGLALGNDPNIVISKLDLKNKVPLIVRLLISLIISSTYGFFVNKFYKYFSNLKSILKGKNNALLSFTLIFISLSLVAKFHFNLGFPGDSGDYWIQSNNFIKNGEFAFSNYSYALRGYSFPFLLFIIKSIGLFFNMDPIFLFKLVNISFFSFSIGVLLPKFFELLNNRKILQYQVILFILVFLIFWGGFVVYPLTDFISVFAVIGSLYFLEFVRRYNRYYLLIIPSGLLMGIALNSRPIYQISALLILIYFILGIFRNKNELYKLALFIVGLAFVLTPQIYINYHNFKILSPFVPTKVAFKSRDLYLTQLAFGINVQRHECGLFIDKQGEALLRTENKPSFVYGVNQNTYTFNKSITTYKQYLNLVINHPIDFTILYLRHLFNGLDTFHNDLYYCDIYASRIAFSLLNYSLWFLLLLYLDIIYKKTKSFYTYVYFLIILLPSIFSIPTAIETRFFIPAYILMYSILCYSSIPLLKAHIQKANLIKLGIIYILFMILCLSVSTQVFIQYESLIIPRLMDEMQTKSENILLR